MDFEPKVTIVLPTFNGSKFLAKSLESCLSQSYSNLEIIVVDDASTDGTPDIIKKFNDSRIIYIRHEKNKGLPAALNTGFAKSTGDYLTWTSDDNYYKDNAIETMLTHLLRNPRTGLVYANYCVVDEHDELVNKHYAAPIRMLYETSSVGACFLYRRNVYATIGGYNEKARYFEDHEYWFRVREKFSIDRLNVFLYCYRTHATTLTHYLRNDPVIVGVEKRKFRMKYRFVSKAEKYHLLATQFIRSGEDKKAGPYIIKALLNNPFNANRWRFFVHIYLSLPYTIFRQLKFLIYAVLGIEFKDAPKFRAIQKVRLLYFIHDLAPFGAQRIVLYTVKNLDKALFSVTVCSLWHEETMKAEFERAGAKVVLLRAKRFFDIFGWFRFLKLLNKLKPDIIHTTVPELGVIARLMKFLFPGIKVIHSFQNPLSSEIPFWRFMNRKTIGLCDAVTFASMGIVDEALAAAPKIRGKYAIIQNSVTLSEHAGKKTDIRAEFNISADAIILLCNGRITRQKGQEVLLNTAAILLKKGLKVKLMLVGDGDMSDILIQNAANLRIEDLVIFTGRRGNIPEILNAANIYVAPSRWESFNIALGEAMLAGLPCVATDIPGHKDLAENGKTALLVKMDEPTEIAAAVEWILKHPAESTVMAAAAKERVMKEFTPEIMGEKYRKLYLGLLK